MFLLTLFGCPDWPAPTTPVATPTAASVAAVVEAQSSSIPDAVPASTPQPQANGYGDCIDCNVIEPNIALRAICDGLGCP